MTKELLNEIQNDYWNEKADPIDMAEVFDLAIKALEQQPCDDCISREAVIKIFGEVHPMDYNTQAYITNIQNLPSVTPSIPDVENNFDIGYNCGYADAMFDISEGSDNE